MTDAEFKHLAKDLRMVVDPRVVLIAEKNGEPVAFSLALPDFNQALKRSMEGFSRLAFPY